MGAKAKLEDSVIESSESNKSSTTDFPNYPNISLKECQARLIVPVYQVRQAIIRKQDVQTKFKSKTRKKIIEKFEQFLFHTEINIETKQKSRIKTPGGIIENWDKTVDERLVKEIEKELQTKISRCEPVLIEFGSRKDGKTGELIHSAIHFYFGELEQVPNVGKINVSDDFADKYNDKTENVIYLNKEQVKSIVPYSSTYDAICKFSDLSTDKPLIVRYEIPDEYNAIVTEKTRREISSECDIFFRKFRAPAKGGFKDLHVLIKTDLFWYNTRVQWQTKQEPDISKFIKKYTNSGEFELEMRKLFFQEELFLKYLQ
ncbi:hypothetical protein HOK51_06175 [Candidatus Woesearchaeota archaeon]|nr:hypothetical protein [Candidatus Woesearchaeota archaeon]MBT6519412.1 hypothetical protein [Candidatus Woesearchaeota archaeon]MBT7368479.1 hypothetical protein [Candidatus Woesearchaeota archaeon]